MELCQPISVIDGGQLHLASGVLASANQVEVVKRDFRVTSSLREAFLCWDVGPAHAMVPHHLCWDARVPL